MYPSSTRSRILKDRQRMLSGSVLWSGRWLMFYGLVVCLGATWLADIEGMRNHPLALPSQAALGPALAALGWYAARSITRPLEQHWAVDALVLYFIASLITFYWNLPRVPVIARLEWLAVVVNFVLLIPLLVYRRRASELAGQPDEPLEAGKAAKMLKEKLVGIIEGGRRKDR